MGGSISSAKKRGARGTQDEKSDRLREFRAHHYSVTCMRVFEGVLVTSSEDRTVKLWKLGGQQESCVVCQGHTHWVTCFDMDVASQILYSGAMDKTLRAWDAKTGKCLQVYEGHGDWVMDLRVTESNVFSTSEDGTVRCWLKGSESNSAGSCAAGSWNAHAAAIKHLIPVSPEVFITAGQDGLVKGWRTTTHASVFAIRAHSGAVTCVALSGGTLFTGGLDTYVKSWDTVTGKLLTEFKRHRGSISCLDVRGTTLFSGSEDFEIRSWNMVTGACNLVFHGHRATVRCVAALSDGVLFSGADELVAWDVSTGKPLREYGWTQTDCICVSGDFVFVSFDGTIVVLDASVSKRLQHTAVKPKLVRVVVDDPREAPPVPLAEP
mmetsp:Transcript_35278/g.80603  ORF Transcript_35278/g.80603 Transcript_35278/m.80603 type:complete len:379 (-) Transcript_35278:65-1201(-)